MINYLANRVRTIYRRGEDFYDLPYALRIDRIANWPRVLYNGYREPLDMENFEWLEITMDKIIICCGGDWQDSMKVTIRMVNGNLAVTDTQANFFEEGMSEDEFNELLFGTADYDLILN